MVKTSSSKPCRWVCSISVLFFSMTMIGCKDPNSGGQSSSSTVASTTSTAPADSVESKGTEQDTTTSKSAEKADYVGNWVFDVAKSVNRTVAANSNIVDSSNIDLFRQSIQEGFNTMELSMEIREDGTFTCRQKTSIEQGNFHGNWTLEGDQVNFLQTHRDDELEEDHMTGKFFGTSLELEHAKDGAIARYAMNRKN